MYSFLCCVLFMWVNINICVCVLLFFLIHLCLTCLCQLVYIYIVSSVLCLCVYECSLVRLSQHVCLFILMCIYVPVANKEEVVQKARPVSSDVGSSNPNFSDLMDEFIQERLRAKGTAVS